MENAYDKVSLIQDFGPVVIDFRQTTEFLQKVHSTIEELPQDPDRQITKSELLERFSPMLQTVDEMNELIEQMQRTDKREEIKAEVRDRILRLDVLLDEFGAFLLEFGTGGDEWYDFEINSGQEF